MSELVGRSLGAPLAVAAVACGAVAQLSCAASIPQYRFTHAEKRAVLPSGLRLMVVPDRTTPMVHVAVRYEVGSAEDPPGKAGLAHLVEHMMFQHRLFGPDKPATFDLLPQLATGFNAFTTFDTTHYYEMARKEELESLLRLEAARMGMLCRTLTEAEFSREREVVRNEIRQRGGTPEGLIPQLILDAVYPAGHAYRATVGGNDEQLANIQFQDVCSFLQRYYTPDRATLIVAGNVDPDEVGRLTMAAFGGIAARKPAPRKAVAPLPPLRHRRIVHELDTERSMVLVAWKLPAFTSDEWQAASAMINTLGRQLGQFNSDWDFATSVNVFSFGGLLAPVAVAALELYDASDVDEALGWVWKATSGLHRDFDEGVFDKRIKNMIKADVITQVESIDARATVLADLVQFRKSFDFRGNGEFLIEELKKIDELDGGDFRDFMKGTLAQDNSVVLVVKSSKKGRKGDKRAPLKYSGRTHEADKTALVNPEEAQRPLPIPGEKTLLSGAEKYALPNGMTVMLLPYRSMPVVTSLLMFDAGSAHEDRERAGLADVTASFLEPPRDSDFWTVGVTFGGWSDPDRTWFIARGVEIYLDVALKGMERIVKVGQHDQDTIEKWQRLMKNLLATDRQKRDWVYRRELDGALFGPQHPYTVTGSPTPETVRRINRDAAMAFKRRHYTARNATLIVAGSFEPAAARKLIAENYGDWPGGHQDAPVARDLPPRAGPIYFGVIEPDSPQMAVTVAYPTVGWIDDNTAARMVLAEMLNLRMAKIRTQLGSTYGTYAQLAQRVGPSAYRMGGNIDAERAGESLKAMRDEIERLRKGDGFDVDFATARRIVVRQLLDEATDSMSLATRLAELARHHIPPAMHNQLLAGIARLTPAQVKALVERELAPDREVVACKGDRAVLSRAFQAAEIGPARLIDPTAPQQPGGR